MSDNPDKLSQNFAASSLRKKIQCFQQQQLVGTVACPKFSEKAIDLLFLLIWLHIEQIACRKSQAIDNREQDLIGWINACILYALDHLD